MIRRIALSVSTLCACAAIGVAGYAQAQHRASFSLKDWWRKYKEEQRQAQPGPMQQMLMQRVGDYTTATQFWASANSRPTRSSGTASLRPAVEGRFLTEEIVNGSGNDAYKGLRIYGFNNATQRYEGVWTYNRTTGMMRLNGNTADGGRTVQYVTEIDQGGSSQHLQLVITQLDPDHFSVDLRDAASGQHEQTLYTRKAATQW